MAEEPFFLDEVLQPLRKLLRYSGLHNGFFPPVEEHRAFYITRCVSTAVILFLLLSFGVYETVQFSVEFSNTKKISTISSNATLCFLTYMALFSLTQFYGNRKQFSEFFQDWKQVEMSVDYRTSTKNHQIIEKGLSIYTYGIVLMGFFLTGFINSFYPNSSIFLSHWEILREKLSIHILVLVMGVCVSFQVIFFVLIESVPALFFYEAGCMIEKLGQELENISLLPHREHSDHMRNKNPYLLIWKKYESIQRSVDRANKLFGFTMIINQFLFVCLACLTIYVILVNDDDDLHPFFFLLLVLVVIRFVMTNWLMSHLYLSGAELKKIAAGTLSEKWFLLSQEDRDIVACFLSRVDGSLVACPLNLYTVDPTNILSLITLHISYTIVLLQTREL